MIEIDTSKEAVNGTCTLLRIPQDLRHVRGEPLAVLIEALAAERDAAVAMAEKAEALIPAAHLSGAFSANELWDGELAKAQDEVADLRARVAALEGALRRAIWWMEQADASDQQHDFLNDGGFDMLPSIIQEIKHVISAATATCNESLQVARSQAAADVLAERHVRHKKRGTTYTVLGPVEMQIAVPESGERVIREGDIITAYQAANGKLWGRFPDEFEDGRFEDIAEIERPDRITGSGEEG